MLLSSSVYDTLLDLVRKDSRGRSLSIEEYNNISVLVNESLFDDYYKEFESDIDSSDTLGFFKKFNEPIALVPDTNNTSAYGTLPTDYYHVIGRPKTIVSNVIRFVDVITAGENAKRQEDYLTQATSVHPTCQIGGITANSDLQIRVYPYSTNTLYLDYLRVSQTPYLDFYVNDTNLNYVYMAEDATVSVPAGNTYRDGTAGGGAGIVSLTKNWEWSDSDLPLILSKFLIHLGVQLPDEVLLQSGVMQETKILQK